MRRDINDTHDPNMQSWVESANASANGGSAPALASIATCARPLPRNSTRARPTAVSVPSTVAISVAAGATMKLFFAARIHSGEPNRFSYQRSDQPPHTVTSSRHVTAATSSAEPRKSIACCRRVNGSRNTELVTTSAGIATDASTSA